MVVVFCSSFRDGISTNQADSFLEPSGESLLNLSLQNKIRMRAPPPLIEDRNHRWTMIMAEQHTLSQYVKYYNFTNHPGCDKHVFIQQSLLNVTMSQAFC